MPKELMERLEAIQGELRDILDNADENAFQNEFYYVDFRIGVSSAIAKLKTTLFNATV